MSDFIRRILLVGRNPARLKTRAELWRGENVICEIAEGEAQGLYRASNEYFMLMIVPQDLDGKGAQDYSGYTLVVEKAPKWLFKTVEYPADPFAPTVPYFANRSYLETHNILDSVPANDWESHKKAVLERLDHLSINDKLHIIERHLTFRELEQKLGVERPALQFGMTEEQLRSARVYELEVLLRKLFFPNERSLRIGPVVWHRGGRMCFLVEAQTRERAEFQYAVVIASPEAARRESDVQESRVLKYFRGQKTEWCRHVETVHFGANLYELVDAQEAPRTLLSRWENGAAEVVAKALDHLRAAQPALDKVPLRRAQESYYFHFHDADESVRLDRLEQVFTVVLRIVADQIQQYGNRLSRSGDRVTLQLNSGEPAPTPYVFGDPIAFARQLIEADFNPLVIAAPGELRADTILTSGDGEIYLTDFLAASESMPLADAAAEVEALIRFDLFERMDFPERILLERLLGWAEPCDTLLGILPLQADELFSLLPGLSNHSQITLREIHTTRSLWATGRLEPAHFRTALFFKIARRLLELGWNPDDDLPELEIRRGFRLLIAWFNCTPLPKEVQAAPRSEDRLRCVNGEFTWRDKRFTAGDTQARLLEHLVVHVEASRRELVLAVNGEKAVRDPEQYKKVNANLDQQIRRLRKTLEDETGIPGDLWIKLIRGFGYRLHNPPEISPTYRDRQTDGGDQPGNVETDGTAVVDLND